MSHIQTYSDMWDPKSETTSKNNIEINNYIYIYDIYN